MSGLRRRKRRGKSRSRRNNSQDRRHKTVFKQVSAQLAASPLDEQLQTELLSLSEGHPELAHAVYEMALCVLRDNPDSPVAKQFAYESIAHANLGLLGLKERVNQQPLEATIEQRLEVVMASLNAARQMSS